MSDETVVDVLAQCEQKLLKTLDVIQGDEDLAKQASGDKSQSAFKTEDIPENNLRVDSMTYEESDEEDEEDEDEEDGEGLEDVPDREYVKITSQQMSDKVTRKSKKKARRFGG